MKFILIIFLLIFSAGCENQKTSHHFTYYEKCKKCGREFTVEAINNIPNIKEYSTKEVEWCFYDGVYCKTGLTMLLKDGLNKDLLAHACQCEGCRYAIFTPEEWKIFVKTVKSGKIDKNDFKTVNPKLLKILSIALK